MKKLLFLLSLFITLCSIQAQDRNWSAEVYYPVSIGDEFGASNQGLIGLGLKYSFASNGKWNFGVSLDGSWFSTEFGSDSDPPQITDVRDLFIQPRFFAALPINRKGNLQLLGGLGRTFYRIKTENLVGEQIISKEEDWDNGTNVNLGLTLDISTSWFLQSQLDLIFISGYIPNSNISLIKIGGGYRF